MDYVPVLGVSPSNSTIKPISHYFNDYLVSMAEPTTSRSWTLQDIFKHMKKIEKTKIQNLKLYLDSGGYQVITGHITERRIKEFTDVYHFIFDNFFNKIDYIFSLDINTPKFSQDKIFEYNQYSIQKSIDFHKKNKNAKDKQLFVVQSRFSHILEDWYQLMSINEIEKYFTKFSFGGLVGLKSEVRSQFNHFVPMTLWLLTYLRSKNSALPEHIHMLGQSSRVALITGVILEKIFNIYITMDSSEIIRFTPIKAKTPLIHKNSSDFSIVRNLEEMESMLKCHSDLQAEDEIFGEIQQLKMGKVTNQTFVEIVSQNISNIIEFANNFVSQFTIDEILSFTKEDFESFHELFRIGRLSTELENNINLIKILKKYFDNGDFDGIHSHVKNIIDNYYVNGACKKGLI